ncbi:MAG: 5-bromo-4-chloroindolyl phosphate hydrolysis family protein, partial [Anaerovoracaceae bacterium]
NGTVNRALHDVNAMFRGNGAPMHDNIFDEPLAKDGPRYEEEPLYKAKSQAQQNGEAQWEAYNQRHSPRETAPLSPKKVSPPGTLSGILFIVFGALDSALFGILLLSYGLLSGVLNFTAGAGFAYGFLLPCFIAGPCMIAGGVGLRKKVTRFKIYQKALAENSYCTIKDLAAAVFKSEKFVLRDLKKMIRPGFFSKGHFDDEKTCFITDDEVYQQYLAAKQWAKEKEAAEEQQKAARAQEDDAARQLRETIEEGQLCIAQIRKANDDIPGEAVSQKLDRLELVVRKIFHHIEGHPEQVTEIRKFMNYYLPTTLKLTSAYSELDRQVAAGDNINSAKMEIEKTLDTINSAFEKLLDDLFYHASMDISSDISVLETMLAQEGLTQSDFNKKN